MLCKYIFIGSEAVNLYNILSDFIYIPQNPLESALYIIIIKTKYSPVEIENISDVIKFAGGKKETGDRVLLHDLITILNQN